MLVKQIYLDKVETNLVQGATECVSWTLCMNLSKVYLLGENPKNVVSVSSRYALMERVTKCVLYLFK